MVADFIAANMEFESKAGYSNQEKIFQNREKNCATTFELINYVEVLTRMQAYKIFFKA
jgi:hypothetical protein